MPRGYAYRFRTFAVLLALAGMAFVALKLFVQTDGELFFTLDDPYIHLSLAENLLRGHYGINPGEYASPSSSILYPFLLAATLAIGLGDWGALALNVLPMLGAVWILAGLLARTRPRIELVLLLTLPLMILAVNGYGLVFTGMEHPLHLLASLLILAGVIRMVETAEPGQPPKVPAWMLAGLVLAPLLRFEGLALSLGGIVVLLSYRRFGAAIVSLAAIVAVFAAHVSLMLRLGLPPLPSSVMVKSEASAAALDGAGTSLLTSMIDATSRVHNNEPARELVISMLLILLALFLPGHALRSRLTVGFLALFAGAAHMVLGKFGWFDRYEIYIAGTLLGALFWLAAPLIRRGNRAAAAFFLLICLALGDNYQDSTRKVPYAAQNIRDQQWQMHRFATEFYPHPVALNDLGWVSYRNDTYVLDLWGLGSEEARRMAETGRTPEKMQDIVSRHGVGWAMVYPLWFKDEIPDSWCRIADLHTIQVTAAHGNVAFYLTDPTQENALRAALTRFQADLLPSTRLEIHACAVDPA